MLEESQFLGKFSAECSVGQDSAFDEGKPHALDTSCTDMDLTRQCEHVASLFKFLLSCRIFPIKWMWAVRMLRI